MRRIENQSKQNLPIEVVHVKLPTNLRIFALKLIDRIPVCLQNFIFKITVETEYLNLRAQVWQINENQPNPGRVYWISPDRICYHTNYIGNNNPKTTPFRDRVFSKQMRGQVVDGDWDITDYKFTELDVYDAFRQRIQNGVKWSDTPFYKRVLSQVGSGQIVWRIKNRKDLDKRCEYLDSLYLSIKENGYLLSRNMDEINVNIGRNGEYLFQNGVHRLSIAKLLGIKIVPVTVFVRHKQWQEFRDFVSIYAKKSIVTGGKLYQPISHPDFAGVPFEQSCTDVFEAILPFVRKNKGRLLDIGANTGYFCHKFEDLGYHCIAVENDTATFQILNRLKIAENRKFEVINKSIFDVKGLENTRFAVVLALNIFHHFLKTETSFQKFRILLNSLKTDMMFFEPHRFDEAQMKNAFINFNESEFVKFILRETKLQHSELIYTAKSGRHLYKLSN